MTTGPPQRDEGTAPVTPTQPAPSLRVALDATALLGRPTGVGAFCAGLLAGLGRRPDLSVNAFAVSWRRRRGIVDAVPPGVAVHQRPMAARPLHAAWRRVGGPPVEWFVGAADVVHGTNFVVPPTRRAGRVMTVHDLTTVRYPEMCTPAALAFPPLIRRALVEGAFVHTPSRFVADEVVDVFGADPDRVQAVHSGVPALPAPGAAAADALARLVPPGATEVVAAVGTAEPRKDLPGLVAAFDRLAGDRPGLVLVLAGPTGWIDDQTRTALLARADVLAYPSVYEGFGFPPLEAMALGTPVVASTAGALPEVLGDAAVLVPPGDPDGLAAALARVLDDPDLAAALAARGSERAAGYTWDACAEGVTDLYRRATPRGGR